MEPMRKSGHDALRKASDSRLDQVSSMKKECAAVRKSFKKYLRGHLFKLEKIRIERHLKSCTVCFSEYQALKRADETRELIRDITPPEGVVQRVKEGVSGLARLRVLLYRPLWIAAIAGLAALFYIKVVMPPPHRDVEIENIEKSLPPPTRAEAPAASAPTVTAAPAAPASAAVQKPREPLAIALTPENEQAAIRRINEALRGHRSLRKLKLSAEVREVSGVLPPEELLAFLDRIEPAGTVSYSRKRLESFPDAEPVPFVLKLKSAPRSAAPKPAPPAAPVSVSPPAPAEAPAAANPSSAPSQTPLP